MALPFPAMYLELHWKRKVTPFSKLSKQSRAAKSRNCNTYRLAERYCHPLPILVSSALLHLHLLAVRP